MRKTIFILLSAAFLVGCNSTGANDGQANTYERATSEGDLERLEHRIKELEEDYISRLEEAEEKIKFSREMIDNISDNFSSTYQGYYDGPLVSFLFDDGRIEDWTLIKPIFEEKDVPSNVALITDRVGKNGYLSWEQAKDLKSLGWSVISHTANHDRELLENEVDIDREFYEARRVLKKHGLDYDILAYPFGETNDKIFDAARRYYKMAVNTVQGGSNESPYVDNYNFHRVAGLSQPRGDEPTLAEVKQTVDDAIAHNKYIIFEDHSHYDSWTEEQLEDLEKLIDYIKEKEVPIVNLQDGFNMRGNIFDQENLKITRDGRIVQ